MATPQGSSQARGVIATLEGTAWIVGVDGSKKLVQLGDEVQEGQVVLTESGTRLELSLPNGAQITVESGRELLIDSNLLGTTPADATEASIKDLNESPNEIARILAKGGDVSDSLDPTAAGLSAGERGDAHDFYRVLRINEALTKLEIGRAQPSAALEFQFSGEPNSTSNAASITRNAPSVLVADVKFAVENTPATGNVLFNDTDIDSTLSVASFTVAGVASTFTAGGPVAIIPGVGSITIAVNGDYTFTAFTNYNGVVPLVSYTTNTGSISTLDISVTPLNDTPVISGNASAGVTEDAATPTLSDTGSLTITDADTG
ncbi:MAG: hypothetical protein RLZ68_670, partial [Pseudomonadota bacterium]